MAAPAPSTFSMLLTILKGYYWLEDGVRNYVQAQGHPEFTRSEGMVMANIILGYHRPSEISRELGISRQAIHTTIHQMRDKGIVELTEDPKNRRIKLVHLTERGMQMRNQGLEAMDIILTELGRRIGTRKVSQLADILAADWGDTMEFDGGDADDGRRRSAPARR